MSGLAKGFSYFLSDKFDNIFKSWATPTKVAFTAGLVTGLGVGIFGRYIFVEAKKAYGNQQRRPLPSLTGELKKEQDGMLAFMHELLSANTNALFNALLIELKKEFTTGIEGNEIKQLIKTVLPRMSMACSSEALGTAQFIAKVVKFLTDSAEVDEESKTTLTNKMKNITRRCFKADILMLYAEDDRHIALEIADDMYNRRITVVMENDYRIGQPELSGLNNVFIECAYVFVICTKNLVGDKVANFKKEMTTMSSILNAEDRLIPLLPKGESKEVIDPVLRVIKSLNYEGDKSIELVEQLIESSYETIFKDELKKK